MKRIIITSMLIVLTLGFLHAAEGNKNTKKNETDSTNYTEIDGKLVDKDTKAPVVFATVFLSGTSIGTVTNTDGEFVLKIPKGKEHGQISFTHLGYENKLMDIASLLNNKNLIEIKSITLPIDEVVVRSIDPESLLLTALNKVYVNYSDVPEMETGFYRETIKQNRKYVSVSEAVLNVYKAPYRTSFDFDRLKIFKGRKSANVKKMDTVVVKLQGGPKTSLLLDVVKNPGDILERESFQYYNFTLAGLTTIDNRETYVIKFDQKDDIQYPLYSGNIYIDTETNAFAGFDFQFSEKGLPYAAKYLVKKKPANMKIDIKSGHYLVRYRKDTDNKWYLNYVRSELNFSTKWKQKLFKSDYHIMLEMAVTDRDKNNVTKFPNRESAKISDILADQVSSFEDSNFWGDYNTIKPDESIEVAIEKLNRKLKRRQ